MSEFSFLLLSFFFQWYTMGVRDPLRVEFGGLKPSSILKQLQTAHRVIQHFNYLSIFYYNRTFSYIIVMSHTGSSGKATRMCDEKQVVPWLEPDMFNCTSSTFLQLRKQVSMF